MAFLMRRIAEFRHFAQVFRKGFGNRIFGVRRIQKTGMG